MDAFGLGREKVFTITVLPPAFLTGFLEYFAANPAVSNVALATFDRETADCFRVYQNELVATRAIDMPVPVNTPAETATNGNSSVSLTLKETMRILAAKTAHAVWLDKEGLVPWRLRDYDTNHLRGLFAKTNLFNPSGSFYFFSVVDHSPTVGYQYAVEFLTRYAGWDQGLTAEELEQAATTLLTRFTETRHLTIGTVGTQGYILDAPSAAACVQDSRVSLKALAKAGYVFSRWTGDVPAGMETANPLVFTMDTDLVAQQAVKRHLGAASWHSIRGRCCE